MVKEKISETEKRERKVEESGKELVSYYPNVGKKVSCQIKNHQEGKRGYGNG